MVEFLSLFLNLVCCMQTVSVGVDGPVAAVEIRLDGSAIGTIKGPPWTMDCDLGQSLMPHLLEAVAFDAEGNELSMASQRINVPRAPAEVRILLERDQAGRPSAGRVMYDSALALKAKRVMIRMDDLPLMGDENNRFTLPEYDAGLIHVLSAEVTFGHQLSARTQLAFGGLYGSDIRTDLTAVPVVTTNDRKWTPPEFEKVLVADGEPCKVVAVENNGVQIFMVQQAGALHRLRQLARMVDSRNLEGFPRHLLVDGASQDPTEDVLHIVTTEPEMISTGTRKIILFPSVGPLTLNRRSMPWVVTHARIPRAPEAPEHLADAVASATVTAAATTSPRAVLLVLADGLSDEGLFHPNEVREYASAMRVPLFVWSVSGLNEAGEWGTYVDVSSPKEMSDAAKRLLTSVRRQNIVWVEGNYLPNQIQIRDPHAGFSFPEDPGLTSGEKR